MPAFAPGFEHDIFVSYAHVDNRRFRKADGWVNTLVNDLREALPQKLKRGQPEIWQDQRLSGNEPFPDNIAQAVTNTAVLLIILSKSYLSSDWCAQERERFIQAAANNGGTRGRLFLVKVDDLEHYLWPETFSGLRGFELFHKANPEAPARTLGTPTAQDPGDELYFQRVDDLSIELANKLFELKQAVTDKPSCVEQKTTVLTLPDDAPTVFLAEVTPDLSELHKSMQRYLNQFNIRALPASFYDRSPEAFRTAMERDLTRSLLFVQLLGPYTSYKTNDYPTGYEGFQLDIAETANIPVLRWHDPDLDPQKVQDMELINRSEVMVMAFEAFKKQVKDTVVKLISTGKGRPVIGGDAFVLINVHHNDMEVADKVAETLEQQSIGFDIVDDDVSLADLAEQDDYHGLLIIYGQCEQDWVQQRVRESRRVIMKKKAHAPVCAVYTGPPVEKPPLRTRPPRFHFLDPQDAIALEKFLSELQIRLSDK